MSVASLFKDIAEYVEIYTSEEKRKSFKIEDFAIWLNNRLSYPDNTSATNGDKSKGVERAFDKTNEQLLSLLHLVNKEFRKRSKPVLEKSGLHSIDDYVFLSILKREKSLKKTVLITKAHMETPTGMDIIRRLLWKRLIKQFKDPDDKRAKRVQLTEKGESELKAVVSNLALISEIIFSKIDKKEKNNLLGSMKKIYDDLSIENKA